MILRTTSDKGTGRNNSTKPSSSPPVASPAKPTGSAGAITPSVAGGSSGGGTTQPPAVKPSTQTPPSGLYASRVGMKTITINFSPGADSDGY